MPDLWVPKGVEQAEADMSTIELNIELGVLWVYKEMKNGRDYKVHTNTQSSLSLS